MHNATGKQKSLAIKVDLKKAYDCLKWIFIRETLQLTGFDTELVRLIMDCISIISRCVLWDGNCPTLSNLLGDFGKETHFLLTYLYFVWRDWLI